MRRRCVMAGVALVCLAAAPLGAAPLPHAATMPVGVGVLTPTAMQRFCRAHPAQCTPSTADRVALDIAQWRTLQTIHRRVNAAIQPIREPNDDIWRLDATAGDCDDYAVQKRQALIAKGWPAGAVGLAVARITRSAYHLVVIVRTDRGDFVLDNLHRDVRAWESLPYRWVMQSSATDPQQWHAIAPPRMPAPEPAPEPAPPAGAATLAAILVPPVPEE